MNPARTHEPTVLYHGCIARQKAQRKIGLNNSVHAAGCQVAVAGVWTGRYAHGMFSECTPLQSKPPPAPVSALTRDATLVTTPFLFKQSLSCDAIIARLYQRQQAKPEKHNTSLCCCAINTDAKHHKPAAQRDALQCSQYPPAPYTHKNTEGAMRTVGSCCARVCVSTPPR